MAKLIFWGAAGQVTGSMYEIKLDTGFRLLVDCGMSYEPGEDMQGNAKFPFEPTEIDAVLLTHAHTDHAGNLPTLISQGFRGDIICTIPTFDLTQILLTDSANIQGLKQKFKSKRLRGRRRLYGHQEVFKTMNHMISWPFDKVLDLNDNLQINFREAGHILGAASIELTIKEGESTRKIGFTGDLGKRGSKLIVDSKPMRGLDYLVMESTYGGRQHKENRKAREVLKQHINKTCLENNGKLIIPAFSVGRTQAILFTLNQMYNDGEIQQFPVFTDGKLAALSSTIHSKFKDFLNKEAGDFLQEHSSLFTFNELDVIEDKDDQDKMKFQTNGHIVVSSAGMLEGGMIREHVMNHIENPNCTFLISGYCAPETLGAKLLRREKQVYIKGKVRQVYASIESTDVFSAHPDQNGLLEYFGEVAAESKLKKVFLIHGEEHSLRAMSELISKEGTQSVIPVKGQMFEI
jgi:metallo-beta-lactamase family protein